VHKHPNTTTAAATTVSQPFIGDYVGEPLPGETFTYSHLLWSSTILRHCFLHLLRSTA